MITADTPMPPACMPRLFATRFIYMLYAVAAAISVIHVTLLSRQRLRVISMRARHRELATLISAAELPLPIIFRHHVVITMPLRDISSQDADDAHAATFFARHFDDTHMLASMLRAVVATAFALITDTPLR